MKTPPPNEKAYEGTPETVGSHYGLDMGTNIASMVGVIESGLSFSMLIPWVRVGAQLEPLFLGEDSQRGEGGISTKSCGPDGLT